MAEILDPEQLLRLLRAFTPLRRVLLATPGTLQGALSAYFGEPIVVEVVEQSRQRGGAIHRAVDLVGARSGVRACRAATEIDVSDPQIEERIADRSAGLGEIVAGLSLDAAFDLVAAGQEDDAFWRQYRLAGPGFTFRITETFPAELY